MTFVQKYVSARSLALVEDFGEIFNVNIPLPVAVEAIMQGKRGPVLKLAMASNRKAGAFARKEYDLIMEVTVRIDAEAGAYKDVLKLSQSISS